MSEPVAAPDSARLDELAAVTRDYATYSRSTCGLAYTAVGSWLVGAFAAVEWYGMAGRILVLFGPFLCAVALVLARRYYQRHGSVLEQRPWDGLQRRSAFEIACLIFGVGVTVARVATSFRAWAPDPDSGIHLALYLAVISLVCAPSIADRVVRGVTDSGCILVPAAAAMMGVFLGGYVLGSFLLGTFAVAGALLAIQGLVEHRKYLRVQTRLRALRREFSGPES